MASDKSSKIFSLIGDYIKKDSVDPKILKKLISLDEKESDDAKRKAFFKAMKEFQDSCPVLETENVVTITNPQNNEDISFIMPSHNEIKQHVLKHATKCGLFFTSRPEDVQNNPNEIDVYLTVGHENGYSKTYKMRAVVSKPIKSGMASERAAAVSLTVKSLIVNAFGITYSGSEKAKEKTQLSFEDWQNVKYPEVVDVDISTDTEATPKGEVHENFIVDRINKECAKNRVDVETLQTHLKAMGLINTDISELTEKDLQTAMEEILKLKGVKNSSGKQAKGN